MERRRLMTHACAVCLSCDYIASESSTDCSVCGCTDLVKTTAEKTFRRVCSCGHRGDAFDTECTKCADPSFLMHGLSVLRRVRMGIETVEALPIVVDDGHRKKQCLTCTFINDARARECKICSMDRLIYTTGEHRWRKRCQNCRYSNKPTDIRCVECKMVLMDSARLIA